MVINVGEDLYQKIKIKPLSVTMTITGRTVEMSVTMTVAGRSAKEMSFSMTMTGRKH